MQTGGRIQPIERVKTKKFLFALNNNETDKSYNLTK